MKIPNSVRQVLDVMYERNENQDAQLTVLELMKHAKLCRINIQQKKNLNKTEHKDTIL